MVRQKRDAFRIPLVFPLAFALAEELDTYEDAVKAAETAVTAAGARTTEEVDQAMAEITLPAAPKWRRGDGHDISRGGLQFTGGDQVALKTVLVVRFTFPSDFLSEMRSEKDVEEISPFGIRVRNVVLEPSAFEEIEARATVVDASLDPQTRKFVHHLAFTVVPNKYLNEIDRFMNLRQRYELSRRNE